jgi:hypothetical protein
VNPTGEKTVFSHCVEVKKRRRNLFTSAVAHGPVIRRPFILEMAVSGKITAPGNRWPLGGMAHSCALFRSGVRRRLWHSSGDAAIGTASSLKGAIFE